MFLTKLELDNQEIEKKEEEFQNIILSESEKLTVFTELRNFFSQANTWDIKKYRFSYWRWYVWLTWDRLNSLSQVDLINIGFGQQLPMVFLLDFNAYGSLMWYFVANNYLENDLEPLYVKLKNTIYESQAILGKWKNKEVTVAEIVNEFYSIKQRGGDALEMAAFSSKLKEIFSPKNDPIFQKYILVNPEDAVTRFSELALFFYLMEPKDIWYAVDVFMHPGRKNPPTESSPVQSPSIPTSTMPPIKPTPPAALVNPPRPKMVAETKIEKPKPMSYLEIKAQVNNQFRKDGSGQFMNISEVLKDLERLAGKYNDDRIRDLYIYNEKDGKFEWNDLLINQK